MTLRKRTDFGVDSLAQDLNNLLEFKEGQQRNAMVLPQMNLTTAAGALAAIIKYLEVSVRLKDSLNTYFENVTEIIDSDT